VSAFFPEVKPAHLANQGVKVEACRMTTAAYRGLEELLARDGVKGKHVTIAKLTIVAFGREKEKKDGQ
jgi:hypothetical protein